MTFNRRFQERRGAIDTAHTVAAALRAVVKAQRALKADPSRALKIGRRPFLSPEAEPIGDVVDLWIQSDTLTLLQFHVSIFQVPRRICRDMTR
jgi:hypothetical protein